MGSRAIALPFVSPPWRRYVPYLVTAAGATTVAAGAFARASGDDLGAPLAPFFASWAPRIGWVALPVGVLLAGAAVLAPRLATGSASPASFAAGALGLSLLTRVAVALASGGGTERLWAVFSTDAEAQREYLPALPALRAGLRTFLDRFAELAPSLPTHPSGHPPGLLVALDLLGVSGARGLAALTIGVGALAAPLTYLLGRSILDERAARIAALLFAFAPSAVIYGATSADALYAALGVAAAWALLTRPRRGAALLALASFFSVALLGAAPWAVGVRWLAGGRRAAVRTAAWAAAGCVLFYGLLFAVCGFDPFGTLRSMSEAYGLGIASVRPYEFWALGSPTAFLVGAGLPVAWLALRALAAAEAPALALAGVVTASALIGFTKAENERIWLFLVPFACVAAAPHLSGRRLRVVLLALAAQALAVQLLLRTIW
jgi:hypothetical protein